MAFMFNLQVILKRLMKDTRILNFHQTAFSNASKWENLSTPVWSQPVVSLAAWWDFLMKFVIWFNEISEIFDFIL